VINNAEINTIYHLFAIRKRILPVPKKLKTTAMHDTQLALPKIPATNPGKTPSTPVACLNDFFCLKEKACIVIISPVKSEKGISMT